jgi:hypothetical protein
LYLNLWVGHLPFSIPHSYYFFGKNRYHLNCFSFKFWHNWFLILKLEFQIKLSKWYCEGKQLREFIVISCSTLNTQKLKLSFFGGYKVELKTKSLSYSLWLHLYWVWPELWILFFGRMWGFWWFWGFCVVEICDNVHLKFRVLSCSSCL